MNPYQNHYNWSLVKKYYESSRFSPENNDLDIPLKIHFIYEKINFISEYEFEWLSFQMLVSNNTEQYYYSRSVKIPYSKGVLDRECAKILTDFFQNKR